MKIFRYKINAPRDEFIAFLSDNDNVNKNIIYNEKLGKPHMHVSANGEKVRIKCEYLGGVSKDNAFIDGTKLRGKIVEKNGYTEFSGIILTAPIFHFLMLLMFSYFIGMCIIKGGFSVIPICLLVFDIFMYKDEFKKQGIIDSYVSRAVKKLNGLKKHK